MPGEFGVGEDKCTLKKKRRRNNRTSLPDKGHLQNPQADIILTGERVDAFP